MAYRRRPVSFNLDNPHQKKLSEFCDKEGGKNFSGFVKDVLFLYMNGKLSAAPMDGGEEETVMEFEPNSTGSEKSLINDIL
ncbi:hypothetical protein J2S74_002326 [Evansella vedderi]|uniref:Uncharacterized protein n=1 Tax=Evansella vedderi TaxID=38282 RepID=A0ABT9ZUQ0_9BACI|nr:hypothetical protein [Evansella vedderi]MDQ0254944.1 hypothetical protein [Evansella vedderi]